MVQVSKMQNVIGKTGAFIILIILTILFFRLNGFFNNKKFAIIKSDGIGYYSFLPALFIYGDYSQGFVEKQVTEYYGNNSNPDISHTIDGKKVNKYSVGTAVMMYPFFITAHMLSYYFHQPHTGYSFIYQYLIGLSAVFYVFVGVYFCMRLLKLYNSSYLQSFFICALIVFGTNLYIFVVFDPSMSHAFSFAAIAAFLFYTKGIVDLKKTGYIIPAFISLALIVIIRPFNGLIVLSLPFIAGSYANFKASLLFILRHYGYALAGSLFAILIVSIQCFIWYKQTGHLFIYSYGDERFYFNKPNIINVLFSYNRGLFIYTPLCFLSLAGFYSLYKKQRFGAVSLFLFLSILIYIMSCWHVWFYGASYGFRPMVEYLPLFAVLLLLSLNLLGKLYLKISFALLCLFALYVNQVQAYQYQNYILHMYNMSSYKYWRVFLRTDDKWKGYVWDNPEPGEIAGKEIATFSTDFEKSQAEWSATATTDIGEKAHSGKMITQLDNNNEYSNTLSLVNDSRINSCAKPVVVVTGFIQSESYFSKNNLQIVISYQNKEGDIYYYRPRFVDDLHHDSNGWDRFDIGMIVNKVASPDDLIKIYFWNPDKKIYRIDDVTVKFIDQS